MQNLFIRHIQAQLPENRSIIEEVSDVLNINYDAAYRRVNSKTSLSLEETITLAKHFKISLNKLYEVGSQYTIIAEKSPKITDCAGLERYFDTSYENIKPLVKMKSASIVYSAKDIPLFYTLKDSWLTRYKIYVWLKFLDEDGSMAGMTFDTFHKRIPNSLLQSAFRLGETYNYIDITEFWNDNTINGTLQQILYYFDSGLLSQKLGISICEDLLDIIAHVEQQTINQTITHSKNNATYNLYKSDLLTMSNTIMVKTQHAQVFFVPFTVLTYLKVAHPQTCKEMNLFFNKQMKNSKHLINAGEKDRILFFTKMRKKVRIVMERIQINDDMMIF